MASLHIHLNEPTLGHRVIHVCRTCHQEWQLRLDQPLSDQLPAHLLSDDHQQQEALQALQLQLDAAVRAEDYETAAQLRDHMQLLQTKHS